MPPQRLTVAIAAALSLLVTTAQAAEAADGAATKKEPVAPASPKGWTYQNAVGIEGNYQNYEEPKTPSSSQTGGFLGITYEGQLAIHRFQFRPEGRFSFGQMDYTSPTGGTMSGVDNYIFEGRALIGYSLHANSPFLNSNGAIITPYFGYGYRTLKYCGNGKITSTGAKAYDRISQYTYIPIGVEALYREVYAGFSIKPTIEYDAFLFGNQESDLSQWNSHAPDMNNSQGKGYGLRASLMASTKADSVVIEFGPFVRYWNISQSKIAYATAVVNGITYTGYGFEPYNNTTEAGLAFKVRF